MLPESTENVMASPALAVEECTTNCGGLKLQLTELAQPYTFSILVVIEPAAPPLIVALSLTPAGAFAILP